MKKIYKDRLLKLAMFLEKLPPRKFNLESFTTIEGPLPSQDLIKDFSCGTTGCAVGWCPVVFPKFCKYSSPVKDYNDKLTCAIIAKNNPNNYIDNQRVTNSSFAWASGFFGINKSYCDYLFLPFHYRKGHRGPKSVASRIRDLVVKNGKVNEETRAFEGDYY